MLVSCCGKSVLRFLRAPNLQGFDVYLLPLRPSIIMSAIFSWTWIIQTLMCCRGCELMGMRHV
jgi:hypothetical protein